MTYKTILVHCDASKSVASRLDVAVGLAQRFNAHLIALDARPPFQPPAFVEGGMDLVPDDYEENVKAGQTAAVAAFAKAIEGKEIASDWRAVDASADSTLIAHARYGDLVIVGQDDPDAPIVLLEPSDLPETVALWTGRAILVVPRVGVQKPVFKGGKASDAARADSRLAFQHSITVPPGGQSRLREMVLGGASRTLLSGMVVPVLMAH